ncbi:O-antigen ligase family protein [Devosia sp. Naph2]|uniref:O-antigen ligase family protein n=1 Tax=Devosia polycyclovorans TaxID=3345148 RepID=UPI0035CEDCD0
MLTALVFCALNFNSMLGPLSVLAFLAAGLCIGAMQVQLALDAMMRWWLVLVLPAYCLVSIAWSQFPEATFRYSLQLALTMVIGLWIATRVSPRNLVRALFFAFLVATLVGLVVARSTGGGAWLGIFGSKNAFAAHIALQILIATGIVLDGAERKDLRLLALGTGALSIPLLIMAQSAGALVVTGPCVLAMVLVALSSFTTGPQKLFLVVAAALLAVALATIAIQFGDALLAGALDATGKDVTLTGRTDLWTLGIELIQQNPWLGVGYKAFWIPGFPLAEQLWAMFGVSSGAGFNFHNTYISNAVEVGLVGLAIQLVLIYVPFFLLLWLAFFRPEPYVAFLLGIQLMLILRSLLEVEVFYEFSGRTILAICTYVHAMVLYRNLRGEAMERQSTMPWPMRSVRS